MPRLLHHRVLGAGGEVAYHLGDGTTVDLLRMRDADLRQLRWQEIAIVFQSAINSLNPVQRISTQLMDVIKANTSRSSSRSRQERARDGAGRYRDRSAGQLPTSCPAGRGSG